MKLCMGEMRVALGWVKFTISLKLNITDLPPPSKIALCAKTANKLMSFNLEFLQVEINHRKCLISPCLSSKNNNLVT